MKRIAAVAVAALIFTACQSGQTGPVSPDVIQQIDQRVIDYYRKMMNLPGRLTMKVTHIMPGILPGLITATLELSNGTTTQKVPLLLTRDGRYMVQGQLTDLTRDPFEVIMEKIAVGDKPLRGNPQATVTIVEYSDFQCPFCGRVYKTIEDQVLKDYSDKVRLIFKHMPIASIHPWAEPAALATECARRQQPEAFWKLYDFLFQNQGDITADNLKDKVEAAARDAGLDVTAFDTCFDSKAAMDSVKADLDEAGTVSVHSTPTFFINGRKLEGAVPYENFKSAIDAALGIPTPAAAPPA